MPPEHPTAQAIALLNQGQEEQARALLLGVLKRSPMDALANKWMAMIHGAHDEYDRAAFFMQRAVASSPRDGELRYILGNVYMGLRKHKESAAAYREALKIVPGNIAASDGLGKCLISLGEYAQAIKVFEQAIAANPDNGDAYGNFAVSLTIIAKMQEAVDVCRRGLARLPDHPGLLETLAYSMNFPQGMDHAEHRRMHERVAASFARIADRPEPVFTVDRNPFRPLRVGFLSGDYSQHACATFMRAPLLNFDRSRVVPVCVATQRHTDGGDADFRKACEWLDVSAMGVNDTARAIEAAKIDILIECSGYTEGHRLRSLVPRTAPIQCTWLGYPNTTGMPTIDYRIIDAITDPPESEWHCTETLARLPGCFLCFTPDATAAPATATPACTDPAAPIVFGSFNRMTKVTPATLDAWCAVLRAVPNSRMLLKLRIASEELRRDTVELFTSRGIDASRVEMTPFTQKADEHARMYARIDIALDCFPYNGTTTTCEATWMGVPVVVVMGDCHRARVGASLNTALGLPELIAANVEEYVAIAVGLASDRAKLAALKASLRERMRGSLLCDGAGYARRFEGLLREIWLRYVASRG